MTSDNQRAAVSKCKGKRQYMRNQTTMEIKIVAQVQCHAQEL